MKSLNAKFVTLLAVIGIISILTVLFSFAKNDKSLKEVTYTLQDTENEFSLSVTWYQDGTNSISSSDEESISRYLNSKFSNYNLQSIENIDVLLYLNDEVEEEKEVITLTAVGMDAQEKQIPIASSFTSNIAQIAVGGVLATDKDHSCSGNPCNCCGFIYETYTYGWPQRHTGKRIVGCECKAEPTTCITISGKCNHTISTSGN